LILFVRFAVRIRRHVEVQANDETLPLFEHFMISCTRRFRTVAACCPLYLIIRSCSVEARNNMVDYKRFSSVKDEASLFDSADLTSIANNLSPIVDATRIIKQSEAHTVAIGEGSHGTKEFYAIRCEITKQLILEKKCNCILIEGDWPDVAALHRFVIGMSPESTIDEAMSGFLRFPRWMWRNETMKDFIQWLCDHNNKLPITQRCGIFGLDVYSLHLSMEAVVQHLESHDSETAALVRKDYSCFDKFGDDPQIYGMLVEKGLVSGCRNAAVHALQLVSGHVKEKCPQQQDDGQGGDDVHLADEAFIAKMNAEVVVGAENYYISMFDATENSWNIRDTHFFNVFQKVHEHFQSTRDSANLVVWAHNSHLGDARYTHLDASRFTSGRELNLGQLLKQTYGEGCLLVGQLTNTGTVMAADDWGDAGQVKKVRSALPGSYEEFFQACAQKVVTLHTTVCGGTYLSMQLNNIFTGEHERFHVGSESARGVQSVDEHWHQAGARYWGDLPSADRAPVALLLL
jgi:erythromycin esterase-like protein